MHDVSVLPRHLHCGSILHMQAAKRIVRDIKTTVDFGLMFGKADEYHFKEYSNSNWPGCVDDMRSTSGSCFLLGTTVITLSSKKQETTAKPIVEVEYIAANSAATQAIWLRKTMSELLEAQEENTIIFTDNHAAIAIA